MSSKPLLERISPLAERDLEDIWLYTLQHWSLEQADAYHMGLMQAIKGLAEGRNIPQKASIREGYWKYPAGRHVIFSACQSNFLMLYAFSIKAWILSAN